MANRYMERCWSQIVREMQSKLQWVIISQLLEQPSSRRQEIPSVGKDVERRGPLCTVCGSAAAVEDSMGVPHPVNVKTRVRGACTPMSTAAAIHSSQDRGTT